MVQRLLPQRLPVLPLKRMEPSVSLSAAEAEVLTKSKYEQVPSALVLSRRRVGLLAVAETMYECHYHHGE